ncbi:hypothetical protein Xvie_01035 [Xenorhabdus vietnamensis]|uniref:Ferric uptake regulation protein n=1 Tax=Xenorhabdus vietnamensis TaxID=351656 RepID=A0A1Y2SG17_9GAMM|nr:hypothetical protein [Xenorhabdus vietnamensis]OTA17642.1 hypothetical protein Xvie_01035 [Xenorhabdus vietnamensis]
MRNFSSQKLAKRDTIKEDKIKSGNITVWDVINVEKILEDVKRFNLNAINVPVQIDVQDVTASKVIVNQYQKQKAIILIEELLKHDIKIIVEPFPFIKQGTIGETEWNPSDINVFFWDWKTVVLQDIFDSITSKYNTYGLKIASNFIHMEYAEGYWNDVIDFVRKQYNGNVIYQMNSWITADWDPSYEAKFIQKINRSYLKKVDIVSIDSWFEVSDKKVPSYEEIIQSLFSTTVYNRNQDVIYQIGRLHRATKKPVYFGGFNIPACEFGLLTPWNPLTSDIFSAEIQINGWRAYRKMMEPRLYFKGFSIWFIGSYDKTHPYQIHSKEAEMIINEWYKE